MNSKQTQLTEKNTHFLVDTYLISEQKLNI